MMKQFYLLIAALLAFLASDAFFTVEQRKYAIVFQFGEAVRVIEQPGLNFKIPFIQNAEYFDKRILNIDAEAKEVTASDEKRIIVDTFAKYQITDPIKFYKTVRNYNGISKRLNSLLESSMRKVIGKVPMITLLSDQRNSIMQQITEAVNQEASRFGVDVIDVRILRADLPQENSEAIFKRMQTEREKEAKQIRAEGKEEAARIRSKAQKEARIILANAQKSSDIMKGQGDAKAAAIYNKAYSTDPEFYSFYRSLETYKDTMEAGDTSFVMSPDSKFLQPLQLNK